MPPQSLQEKLDVLGSFAAADKVRKVWGTKLLVRANGDMERQEAGFYTFWSRNASDSLTNPAVHNQVQLVFDTALTKVHSATHFRNHNFDLQQRILYAFKGYSTLVRRGYADRGNALKDQVRAIGDRVGKLCVPIACNTYFNQAHHIPQESEGMCFGFALDWLRRCYKQKYGYGYGLVQTGPVKSLSNPARQGMTSELTKGGKLASIQGIQENQLLIKNDGTRSRPIMGYPASMSRDVPIVSNRLSTAADQNREAAYARRFGGMILHQEYGFPVPEEERRCCGIGPPGATEEPWVIRSIDDMVVRDQLAQGNRACGWLILMYFKNFFTNRYENGHAIGMFSEGVGTGRYHCFDPNHGTVSGFQDLAFAWLRFAICRWSLQYCIPSVKIHRVSAA
jgi:hypothetical protein